MPLFVEFGQAGPIAGGAGSAMPVEIGSQIGWSETVANGALSTGAADKAGVMSVTPTVSGYVSFGKTPDASKDPRRRVLSGTRTTFGVAPGERVSWVEG